jgi:hypothetical protein
MSDRLKTYNVYGTVVGGKFIGTFKAKTKKEALEKALDHVHVSLCHHCASECENAEVDKLTAEEVDER